MITITSNFIIIERLGHVYLRGNPTKWVNIDNNYYFDSYFEFNKEILN